MNLPTAFPFQISLFRLRDGAVTRQLTWHQRLELLMPLDGPLRERIGDLVVKLQPGDVLVMDHLKPHQVVEDPWLNTRIVVITFMQEWVFAPGSAPSYSPSLTPFHPQPDPPPGTPRRPPPLQRAVHDAIRRLLACYFGPAPAYREAGCKAWLLVILQALLQAFPDSDVDRGVILRRQEIAARVQPVLDHVRRHYAERLPIADAADLCGMSAGRFVRMFKQACGITLVAYVHQVRMARALELLEQTTAPISSIASQLGFSDQSHFDRRFRRAFGCSPSQHRRGRPRDGEGTLG